MGSAAARRAGWRQEAAPPPRACFRRAAPRGADAGSGRRARPRERSGGGPGRPGVAPWWPSSASAWPTRSTARTSRSEGTSPRPRGRPRRRRRRSGPGCWRCSSSWFADQPSSRSSRASGWACEGAPSPARAPRRCHGLCPPRPVAAAAGGQRPAFQVPSPVIPSFLAPATVP